MRRTLFVLSALSLCTLWASAGSAAMVEMNGTIDSNDAYECAAPDTWLVEADGTVSATGDESAEDYYGSGLDIDTLYLAADGADRFIGVSVDPVDDGSDNAFLPAGSPTSYAGVTGLNLMFYDAAPADPTNPPSATMTVNLVFDEGGLVEGTIYEDHPDDGRTVTTLLHFGLVIDPLTGVSADPAMASKFDVAFGDGLELRLDEGLFLNDVNCLNHVLAQLDDTGAWQDDQLYSHLPEPSAMVLLGLGAVGLLRRRRT